MTAMIQKRTTMVVSAQGFTAAPRTAGDECSDTRVRALSAKLLFPHRSNVAAKGDSVGGYAP